MVKGRHFGCCPYDYSFSYQIAREMAISPQNAKLGLTALTKRVGLMDRPDNPGGELIKYRACSLTLTELQLKICSLYSHILFNSMILIN